MVGVADVKSFLGGFKAKMNVFGVLFFDARGKNTQAMLDLEITPSDREKVLKNLLPEDYVEGPKEDLVYGGSNMWVFGKVLDNKEIYIKISMGEINRRVICISFHMAEYPLEYPFKQKQL